MKSCVHLVGKLFSKRESCQFPILHFILFFGEGVEKEEGGRNPDDETKGNKNFHLERQRHSQSRLIRMRSTDRWVT